MSKSKKSPRVLDEPESIATQRANAGGSASEENGLEAASPKQSEQPEGDRPEQPEQKEEAGLAPVEKSEPSEVEALRSELEEVQDLLRRKQAEFENYRKRVEREQREVVAYAASELALEILPVLDNLERALESSPGDSPDQFREGVEIIYRQFHDTLKKAGLRELDALGQDFDPHVHEAVARVVSPDHREGKVLEVLQKGYFFKDRLLRPAMVKVGHNPSLGESDNDSESSGEADATDYPNSDA